MQNGRFRWVSAWFLRWLGLRRADAVGLVDHEAGGAGHALQPRLETAPPTREIGHFMLFDAILRFISCDFMLFSSDFMRCSSYFMLFSSDFEVFHAISISHRFQCRGSTCRRRAPSARAPRRASQRRRWPSRATPRLTCVSNSSMARVKRLISSYFILFLDLFLHFSSMFFLFLPFFTSVRTKKHP